MMYGLIILVCLLTCAGQLCQKQAVECWKTKPYRWQQKLFHPWLISGLFSMGVGMLLWLIVLKFVPLNRAYPMLSLNFVLVTLASHFWFKEASHWRHWFGIACIMAGVILVGAGL